jgi:twitching motility two-component system response regulator PilH
MIPSRSEQAFDGPKDQEPSVPISQKIRLKRVLIVDDSKTVVLVMRTYLMNSGFVFDAAADVAQAMCLVLQHPPDFVISDIQMPGSSGFDLIRAFRRLPALAHIRFFLMTSSWTLERRREAIELKVEACLQKPVNADRLLKILKYGPYVGTPLV